MLEIIIVSSFLQYCRFHLALGLVSSWRWQETKEEELHHPKESQAQAQEGKLGSPQKLQS